MDVPLLIKLRLRALALEQRDLAVAVTTTSGNSAPENGHLKSTHAYSSGKLPKKASRLRSGLRRGGSREAVLGRNRRAFILRRLPSW